MAENTINPNHSNQKENSDDYRRCTEDKNNQDNSFSVNKTTSMSTLILWNISKALEKNPAIDLKEAIKSAQDRIEKNSRDVNALISRHPEERYIACALLAWQQLGHQDADSLYQFYETKRIHKECSSKVATNTKDIGLKSCDYKYDPNSLCNNKDFNYSKGNEFANFASFSMGPVVKLPLQTKIVMRLENAPSSRQVPKKQKVQDKDIMDKIDAACCLETGCVERLATLDAITNELRTRAGKLARREAERVELLERAEAAWKDLELGYHRRLTLAEEKEEDMTKRIQKLIEERNGYKNACTTLAQQLRLKSEAADKDRARLIQVEKDVCDRACIRLRLSEESTRGEALLAEHQCKAAQLERDLQFKEEQARRKLLSMESEAESARALTHEAERAMRAELGALKEQVAQYSDQLLQEDAENNRIKQELDELRLEKMGMVEDLDGCKVMCDNRMQGRVDELKKKREQLNELKEIVMECRCKLPVDVTVEAKRTPSLAALCKCTPEDKILESCSCTSLRSRLLSNLLSDLFGGLQAELGGTGSQMPCQLLKCLEDKHNWDRASVVKTNLRDFFSQLLIGELDIAIATSIENYHAKWVGASCADEVKLISDPGETQNEGWQERVLELQAQKLATQLAEQLFQERADQLTQRAKEIVTTGPPPCECKPQPALFPCLVKTPHPVSSGGVGASAYWRRTFQDVTQLRLELDDLKKDSIKRQDLQLMEDNITKILQHPAESVSEELATETIEKIKGVEETSKRENKNVKTINPELSRYCVPHNKHSVVKKRQLDITVSPRKGNRSSFNQNMDIDKSSKSYKKQTFAVNMCLCSAQKASQKLTQQCKPLQNVIHIDERKSFGKHKAPKEIDSQVSSIRHTKPINTDLPTTDSNDISDNKISVEQSCRSDCVCFNKMPSNTSIDKLLETLLKWKCDITASKNKKGSEINIMSGNRHNNEIKDNSMTETKPSKICKVDSNKSGGISDCKLCSISCNASAVNIRSSEGAHNVPTTTESEYMGAVNLDKSHENVCKCNKKCIQNKIHTSKNNEETSETPKFAYQCIHSPDCLCEKSIGIKKEKTAVQSQSQTHTQYNNNKESQMFQNNVKVVSILEETSEIPKNIQKTGKENTDKLHTNIKEKSELFPCDCDYHIKFLGVTLVNTDSTKKKKSVKENSSSHDDNSSYKKCSTNLENQHKQHDNINNYKCCDIYDHNESCDNNICITNKYDELMSSVDKKFIKDNIEENKTAEDILNLTDNVEKEECCICCNVMNVDESKDLEENAFHLLEYHLKEQLEEFKTSSCKSSYISQDEEQKILTTILHNVRQVISDSTKQITCKCSGLHPTEGSWNRAYGLLQEYLRTKMKRVQCLCISKENDNSTSPQLDNVLEKVCNLIENDFERLKIICNCKHTKPNQTYYTEETPVKDTDNLVLCDFAKSKRVDILDTNATCSNYEKVSKQNSNKSMVLTQNISSQVPPNLGMTTKSCDAMERGTKNIQTIEIISNIDNFKSTNYNSLDRNCSSNLVEHNNGPILVANEILINHCTDVSIKEDMYVNPPSYKPSKCSVSDESKCVLSFPESSKSIEIKENNSENTEHFDYKQKEMTNITNHPYIGYTVNCSCDNKLGSCVCMKSVVQKNNDIIRKIWERYTENNNACVRNISYIMNSIPNRMNASINMVDCDNVLIMSQLTENVYTNNIPKTEPIENKKVCEVEISVQDDEEMVLKDSRETCEGINNTTNTFDENASVGTNYSNFEDPMDWYECGSQLHKLQNDLLDDRFENSMYFPVPINRYQENVKEELLADIKTVQLSNVPSCNCSMVPICHVKMLVENIEDKLVNLKCTCDSLIAKVCPVHSSKLTKLSQEKYYT